MMPSLSIAVPLSGDQPPGYRFLIELQALYEPKMIHCGDLINP
jgi:hypothetical protein